MHFLDVRCKSKEEKQDIALVERTMAILASSVATSRSEGSKHSVEVAWQDGCATDLSKVALTFVFALHFVLSFYMTLTVTFALASRSMLRCMSDALL